MPAENSRPATSLFTHIDVTTTSTTGASGAEGGSVGTLLSQMLAAQHRQNELMEQLIQQLSAAQRQRSDLARAHPNSKINNS